MEKEASQTQTKPVTLLGVEYTHIHTEEGGDLYLTRYGLPFMEQLKPENWKADSWFKENRESLPGTSNVYKLPTKSVQGRSLDLVVKYCRVGEDVPLDTMGFDKFWFAEFNTPYEEFSLVMEMRQASAPHNRILTHKPLAIYVPPERLQLWQTGRSKHRIARKTSKFRDIELDIYRQYIMIYEWIKGVSAPEAVKLLERDAALEREVTDLGDALRDLTIETRKRMMESGFMVIDHKPAHIILRPLKGGKLLRRSSGEYAFALVDFELLVRTPKHERDVKASRRKEYMWHLGHRFDPLDMAAFPKHLKPAEIFNVDYVFGHAESTGGELWVVGNDPGLFDYFLPERWRHTPREQMSQVRETFYTVSKDEIHLIWKVSSVGETLTIPLLDGPVPREKKVGYNSPFEEFCIAQELIAKKISCVYPRAIYMAGLRSPHGLDYITDVSCYERHEGLITPEGKPLLKPDHNYLTIWGFWRKVNSRSDGTGQVASEGISLQSAVDRGLVLRSSVDELIALTQRRLREVGFAADYLKSTHLLVSQLPDLSILKESDGTPLVTICNFELIRRL